MPTFVEIAGGPKGDGLKKQIEKGEYPGIVKTTLDGVNQIDYLTGKSDKSARDVLLLLLKQDPVGGAVQELEDVLRDGGSTPTGFVTGVVPYAWTQVVNIKRDPFETSLGEHTKTHVRCRRSPWWSGHRLRLRLEHAADRPGAVAEAPSDLRRLPAVCRTRPATIWTRSCSRSGK